MIPFVFFRDVVDPVILGGFTHADQHDTLVKLLVEELTSHAYYLGSRMHHSSKSV